LLEVHALWKPVDAGLLTQLASSGVLERFIGAYEPAGQRPHPCERLTRTLHE
jgi:hypothetical protein